MLRIIHDAELNMCRMGVFVLRWVEVRVEWKGLMEKKGGSGVVCFAL